MEPKPLLAPGLHSLNLIEVGYLCLKNFPDSQTRESLVRGLIEYIACLSQVGIPIEVWIDGSFTTNKKDPKDVDMVIYILDSDYNTLSPMKKNLLENLTERASMRSKFHCDVYCCESNDSDSRVRWQKKYGFSRESGKPKGIAKITVMP